MQFRIVQDARDGLWRWVLVDGASGRALARSLEAYVDGTACREAVASAFDGTGPREWEGDPSAAVRSSGEDAARAGEPEGGFEDVGLKRNEAAAMPEGEAEPQPMPQIGR
jgi:hypothetical protein